MALNNLKQSPIPVVPRQMQIVNPDGTPTRSGQLLLQQLVNTNFVNYGSSTDMANAANLPDGALYCQTDRNGVLYQLQDGEWHYIAGTMWNFLNPDQRPKGLGGNDAGFEFRSIDTDTNYAPREFIWSGAEWVETTLVEYGTHAARPPADERTPSRTLYVETDRTVLYQNQNNAWVYVAGTMWGTISPDQRPAGLGTNDDGFLFETTDSYELYRWTGSAWANSTQSNTVDFAMASAQLALTTSAQDIPGVSVTLTRNGRYCAMATISFQEYGGDAGSVFYGSIVVGGTAQGGAIVYRCGNGTGTTAGGGTVSQTVGFTVSTAPVVVKLQAYKSGGTGGSVTDAYHSTLSLIWIGP
jgi:hypothetical protein